MTVTVSILFVFCSRLCHEDYNLLASKIVALFPTEVTATYYVPSIKKNESITGKPILAKGKLVDKCRNLLHCCNDVVPVMRKRKNSQLPSEEKNKRLKPEIPGNYIQLARCL